MLPPRGVRWLYRGQGRLLGAGSSPPPIGECLKDWDDAPPLGGKFFSDSPGSSLV